MKTPEKIKKGLECTADYIERTVGANNHSAMLRDALAYIQQLEQINADFAERTAQLEAQAGVFEYFAAVQNETGL